MLFDLLGGDPGICCYWCSAPLEWLPKDAPNAVQVDHLDGDGGNNDPANLVPACARCNSARGKGVLHYILRDNPEANLDELAVWGPIKGSFPACGHLFEAGNVMTTGSHEHRCIICNRRRAKAHYNAHH